MTSSSRTSRPTRRNMSSRASLNLLRPSRLLVTGENWDQGRGLRGGDLFAATPPSSTSSTSTRSTRTGGRIKTLHEYIGQSYFDYLAELPDLVLLMDEAHRYRGKAGLRAVAELQPVLGLELTATPRSVGAKSERFKNVIYRLQPWPGDGGRLCQGTGRCDAQRFPRRQRDAGAVGADQAGRRHPLP